MSVADTQPRTQFGDVQFPSEVTHLRMQVRHHVHEYPHVPGGKPEKLGRGLYRVSVLAQFHTTFPKYPNLYPAGMVKLRGYAELSVTKDFVHPSVGSFPAFITNWDQTKTGRVRSGESVEIEFLEDQSPAITLATIAFAGLSASFAADGAQLAAELAKVQADPHTRNGISKNGLGIFDALQAAVNSISAIKDSAQLYGNTYAAKLQGILNLTQQLDADIGLQDARAWPVIDALRTMQAHTVDSLNNLQQTAQTLLTFTVPSTQSLAQVAIRLFGDAGQAGSLLSLNGARIDDPMRVTAGTPLRYYPPSPQERA